MKKTRNISCKKITLLVLLVGALTSLSCYSTLAKNSNQTNATVASSPKENETELNSANKDEVKREKWAEMSEKFKRDSNNFDEGFINKNLNVSLDTKTYDKLNEYRIKDRQSLLEGLEYAKKSFDECKEILDGFENIEVFGYKSDGIPQTFLCAKEKKCGFNVSVFPVKDVNRKTCSYIYIPSSLPFNHPKSMQLRHFLEHVSVSSLTWASKTCPNFFDNNDFLENAVTYADGGMAFLSFGFPNPLMWFKAVLSCFDDFKKISKEEMGEIFKIERKRIYEEELIYSILYNENSKFCGVPLELLYDEIFSTTGRSKNKYDPPGIKILEKITDKEVFETHKKMIHPSNMCAKFCTENKLGDIFNFLLAIKEYCKGYERSKSQFLKTKAQQREYIRKYHCKENFKNENARYVKRAFSASDKVNLFRKCRYSENAEGKPKCEDFNVVSDFVLDLYDLGIKDTSSSIADLFFLQPDAIKAVLGEDKIKKLTGFEEFTLMLPFGFDGGESMYVYFPDSFVKPMNRLWFHICGSDESSFSKDNLAKNVHKVLKAFAEECGKMSDDEFFKLNFLGCSRADSFSYVDENAIGSAVLRSYDGDKFNVSKTLNIKDGLLQHNKKVYKEGIIKNRHLIQDSLARPFNSYTAYVATRMNGTSSPKDSPKKEFNTPLNKEYAFEFKIPVKFKCDNNELGFITKYIFSEFFGFTLLNNGWSYLTSIEEGGGPGSLSSQIKPVEEYLKTRDTKLNVNFFKKRFDDGTIKNFYNNFIKNGLSGVYANFSIDEYINIVKSKFTHYIKRNIAYLYDLYKTNLKLIEKLDGVKDFDNISDDFVLNTRVLLPSIELVKRLPISNISKKYKNFVDKYKKYYKTSIEKRKEIDNKYKDRYKKNGSDSLEKEYRKEIVLFRKKIIHDLQKYAEQMRDILMEELKVYETSEDLTVENIKESLRKNVKFEKFEKVNGKEKSAESEENSKSAR